MEAPSAFLIALISLDVDAGEGQGAANLRFPAFAVARCAANALASH
jgi:hypothetical protein